jgi:hypothetical protein
MKLLTLVCMASATLLAACGGGGASSSPSLAPSGSTQAVSGTLTIGNPGSMAMSSRRAPAFVSASTKHVVLFIDGAATASSVTTTCGASTATGCTIAWAAQLTVPNVHLFAVEADSGTNAPANTVLSVGSASYQIVAGSANSLTIPSLNGIAHTATISVGTCSGTTPNSSCNGTVTLADPANNAIAYTGATIVPTTGNAPSSGNIFDNGVATFASSAPAVGTITGTAQAPFSSLAAGTLTVSGVNTTGSYTYQVTCAAGATGTFGITAGGASTIDTVVTPAELAGLSPAVSQPPAGLVVMGTPASFTCVGGNIDSTAGSLTLN